MPLRAIAYRMLGSLTAADDAVQEGWLRLSRSDTRAVENLDAWLTTPIVLARGSSLRQTVVMLGSQEERVAFWRA
jgi:DNA-directed RNA polymerase specialized sigma24 family protein